MLECVFKIEDVVKNISEKDFKADFHIHDLALRSLEIMGEAAKGVPDEMRQKFQDIPWKNIIGMRNIIIHDYFEVDMDQVWEVVSRHMESLQSNLTLMLRQACNMSDAELNDYLDEIKSDIL